MQDMGFLTAIMPLFTISFTIWGILQIVFKLVEGFPFVKGVIQKDPAKYASWKEVFAIIAGCIAGVWIAYYLDIGFFRTLGFLTVSPKADRLITGLAAGAMAPFIHQIFGFFKSIVVLLKVMEITLPSAPESTVASDQIEVTTTVTAPANQVVSVDSPAIDLK